MIKTDLKDRTRKFAIRVVKLCNSLNKRNWIEITFGKQLLRSGTSAAANYRAVVIAKSDKDFINKLKIVEEELDESVFWMEMLIETEIVKKEKLELLLKEAVELQKIISASIITTKKKRKAQKLKSKISN